MYYWTTPKISKTDKDYQGGDIWKQLIDEEFVTKQFMTMQEFDDDNMHWKKYPVDSHCYIDDTHAVGDIRGWITTCYDNPNKNTAGAIQVYGVSEKKWDDIRRVCWFKPKPGYERQFEEAARWLLSYRGFGHSHYKTILATYAKFFPHLENHLSNPIPLIDKFRASVETIEFYTNQLRAGSNHYGTKQRSNQYLPSFEILLAKWKQFSGVCNGTYWSTVMPLKELGTGEDIDSLHHLFTTYINSVVIAQNFQYNHLRARKIVEALEKFYCDPEVLVKLEPLSDIRNGRELREWYRIYMEGHHKRFAINDVDLYAAL